jgi:hypothetical protein
MREHSIPEEDFEGLRREDSMLDSEDEEDGTPETWISLGSARSLYANVPALLAVEIQENLETYLPLCNDDDDNDDWKLLFSYEDSHRAYQRLDANGRSTIKSVAVLNHPPKQVFSLLIDIQRRREFETNVRVNDQIRELNPHTFLDYYAYYAVRFEKLAQSLWLSLSFPFPHCCLCLLIYLFIERFGQLMHVNLL